MNKRRAVAAGMGMCLLGLAPGMSQAGSQELSRAVFSSGNASVGYFMSIGLGDDNRFADDIPRDLPPDFDEQLGPLTKSGSSGSATAAATGSVILGLGPGIDDDETIIKYLTADSSLRGSTTEIEDPNDPSYPTSSPSADMNVNFYLLGDQPLPYVINASTSATNTDQGSCSSAEVVLEGPSGEIFRRNSRAGGNCGPAEPNVGSASGLLRGDDTGYSLYADSNAAVASPQGSDSSSASYSLTLYFPPPCTVMGTAGNDTLRGTANNDVICGLGGDDTIDGQLGGDSIIGGPGGDTILGGRGNDMLVGGEGDDDIRGDAGGDLIFGNEGDDSIGGGNGDDYSTDDLASLGLFGGGGNDIISGGRGIDLLDGQDGYDIVSGGPENDALIETGIASGAFTNEILSGDDGDDSISGTESTSKIEGGDGNDTLVGTPLADKIDGGAGDDVLNGLGSDDILSGGAGSDTLNGGDANDVLTGGTRKDALHGDKGNDTLKANDGVRDVVDGGVDRDTASVDELDDVTGCETVT